MLCAIFGTFAPAATQRLCWLYFFKLLMPSSPTSPKYIGFVSNSAWYIFIHRWDVIVFLLQQGYNVLIVAPPDREVQAFNRHGIKYVPFEFSNKSRNPLEALTLYGRLTRLYKQYKPLFLFHYAIKANTFGNLAARRAGIPCVSIVNGIGYSFLQKNLLYHVVKMLYRQTLQIPREVWFLNTDDGALFIKEGLVDVSKVHILHGEGINTAYYAKAHFEAIQPPSTFTFIIATRLLYSKGIGVLANALKILHNKGLSCACKLLAVVDDGHPDSIPQTVIEQWQSEKIFDVLPFTEEVRPHLAAAHCFVLPSYYNEGLPRCIMEAASMELPVITTNEKGCREAIIDAVSGFYCKTKDPVDLAEKMETMMLLTDADRHAMGNAGRKLMQQKFEVERICREYLRVLEA